MTSATFLGARPSTDESTNVDDSSALPTSLPAFSGAGNELQFRGQRSSYDDEPWTAPYKSSTGVRPLDGPSVHSLTLSFAHGRGALLSCSPHFTTTDASNEPFILIEPTKRAANMPIGPYASVWQGTVVQLGRQCTWHSAAYLQPSAPPPTYSVSHYEGTGTHKSSA